MDMKKTTLAVLMAAVFTAPAVLANQTANGLGDDTAAYGDVVSANGPGNDVNNSGNLNDNGAGDDGNGNTLTKGDGNDNNNNINTIGDGNDGHNRDNVYTNTNNGDDGDDRNNSYSKSVGWGNGNDRDNLMDTNDGDDGHDRNNSYTKTVATGNGDNRDNNTATNNGDDGDNRNNSYTKTKTIATQTTLSKSLSAEKWVSESALEGGVSYNRVSLSNTRSGFGAGEGGGLNQRISTSVNNALDGYTSTGVGQAASNSAAQAMTQQSVAVNASIHNAGNGGGNL
ncbi:hypothetical protein NF212_11725 [Parasalinivibrio latis]|uniref:hypothetical protein n=1 Tax=Parasalinivibrio latis TaxID=2952610 RepID=UPI0030E43E76